MAFKKGNIPWNVGKKMDSKFREKIIKASKKPNYGMKGKKHSEETKDKIRNKAIGRKHTLESRNKISIKTKGKPHSKEHNIKVSLALKGKKKSKEHIRKIREIAKKRLYGKTYEEVHGLEKAKEIKEKLSKINSGKNNNMFGKTHSQETRKKISEATKGRISPNKGKPCSEEVKKYLSDLFKGKHHSPDNEFKKGHKTWIEGKTHSKETRQKLREKNTGRKRTEEVKRKMSIIAKNAFINGERAKCIGAMGKENPSWNGGISFEPYNEDFNKMFKIDIRNRDKNVCMICEINKDKANKNLSIHHIDYNKLNSIQENCISLCDSCHTKTNFNRKHWTKFFQSLLSEEYEYKYSELNEMIININERLAL